ncbi:TetR/AcrR family transcriptional regulator [Microbispora bryophytorum]|uniref:TetR family transcriptional regulator n=1 Tax=Microbispora bryophytorum TaxID=1460882 RepID=A0A8H9H1K4_9ACTN|nr:TetR/AcrR family transcriptional regulator [Microbispora bryophytorum]GGO18845.1 TetR family transcriptional regulator [Microbispora bryophytorum]
MLRAAAEMFATEGLSVPVHEIARRAGVGTGTGTVSRRFPSKEALFAAVLLDRMALLTTRADALMATEDPGTAFFTFFAALAHEGADHRGLAESLAGVGFDIESAAIDAGSDVSGRLHAMLKATRRAGAVRGGITFADVKALMSGCLAREVAQATPAPTTALSPSSATVFVPGDRFTAQFART